MKMVRTVISAATATVKSELTNSKYEEAVKTLNTLQTNAQTLEKIRHERDKYAHLNIPNMLKFAERVGISEEDMDSLNVVHISGTKGKGSTCAFCESILRSHGYKTGFYSSPHLVEVRERFRIDGRPLRREMFASYFWDVYHKLEESKQLYEGKMPNYFGFLTVMALHVFLQEKVDVAIMEVGIGGQYDCTNLIKNPVVCGVSSLGLDHTSILGNSVDKIAWHKAGIFKHGAPAFTAPQQDRAMEVLKNRAIEREVSLAVCPELSEYDSKGRQLRLGIKGSMQRVNASLALQISRYWINKYADSEMSVERAETDACNVKKAEAFQLSEEMKRGLEECSWLGRNQKITQPGLTFYLDGAHTAESIQQCVEWFQDEMCLEERKRKKDAYKVLIFNTTGDRDTSVLLQPLTVCEFDAVLFCPNVAFHACNSADQDNKTVTKESQINRCLLNKHTWEKLTRPSAQQTTEESGSISGIRKTVTKSELGKAVVNGYGTEVAVTNGDLVISHERVIVNGFVAEKESSMVNVDSSVESSQHEGPTSSKRLRNDQQVLNGFPDHGHDRGQGNHSVAVEATYNGIGDSIQEKHIVHVEQCDVNHNQNREDEADLDYEKIAGSIKGLHYPKTVIHAFPSISHCINWTMEGIKLRDRFSQGRGEETAEGGKKEHSAETKADLEGFDDNVPEIGDKHVHILVTGSLHLVGGTLRVIQGEDACS